MKNKHSGLIVIILCILLSIAAPILELILGIFEETFYSVFPSITHIMLFFLIPISVLFSEIMLRISDKHNENFRIIKISILISLTLTLAFSIYLLPVLWLIILSIFAYGLGILGLTPYFMLGIAFYQFSRWKEKYHKPLRHNEAKATLWPGLMMGIIVFIILIWTPFMLIPTKIILQSNSPIIKNCYVRLVEITANRELFRRECYEYNTFISKIIPDRNRDPMHELYYFVYGVRPGIASLEEGIWQNKWEFNTADFIHSEWIGETVPELYLDNSELEITANSERSMFQYIWNLSFANEDSKSLSAAKTLVQIPPYSTISGIKLIIGDKEFTGGEQYLEWWETKGKIPEETVTNQVIAEMTGQDMIYFRLLNIPENENIEVEIKLIGVYLDRKHLLMPRFVEKNFIIPEKFNHQISFAGDGDFFTMSETNTNIIIHSKTNINIQNQIFADPSFYFTYAQYIPDYLKIYEDVLDYDFGHISRIRDKPLLVIDGNYSILSKMKSIYWNPDDYQAVYIARPYGYWEWNTNRSLNLFIGWKKGYSAVDPSEALIAAYQAVDGVNPTIIYIHGSHQTDFSHIWTNQSMKNGHEDTRLLTMQLEDGASSLYFNNRYMKFYHRITSIGDIDSDMERILDRAHMYFPDFVSIVKDGEYLGARYESECMIVPYDDFIRGIPFRMYLYSSILNEWFTEDNISSSSKRSVKYEHLVTPETPLSAIAYKNVFTPDIPNWKTNAVEIPILDESDTFLIWR